MIVCKHHPNEEVSIYNKENKDLGCLKCYYEKSLNKLNVDSVSKETLLKHSQKVIGELQEVKEKVKLK